MSQSIENNVKPEDVRARFAPSPTGDLHVGGVRTALFNWLFARHHGGKFLLRIEDTDRQRSTGEAIQVILDGLRWMGIDWDEEIVFQSQRADRHAKAAKALIAAGAAYRCFCSPEVIREKREKALAEKKPILYDRTCLLLSPGEVEKKLAAGEKFAVRLMIPDGAVTFNDGVRGEVTVRNSEIDDFIILRSDGSPTYMLAVVVDDVDMGVTDIIRGDDHLSNTPKQILLYQALGATPQRFAHVPLILGADKKRLSKRHGATSITAYREMGYLPETLINYLGLLGWSPGDDRNVIDRRELIDLYDVNGINSRSAVFDEKKLEWLNGQYLQQKSYDDIADDIGHFAQKSVDEGTLQEMPDEVRLRGVWELMKVRVHRLDSLFEDASYLFQDPNEFDPKGVRKQFLREGVGELISDMTQRLENLEPFSTEKIEALIRSKAEELETGAGKLIHPIRLAVSGVTGGPSLFEMLEFLGKDTVIRRLMRVAERIENGEFSGTE